MKNELTSSRLKEALAEYGMKPQDLADRSGVSKSSISQYINGSHAPSNISSGKMGKVLNVNPMWLMGFDVPKRKNKSQIEAEKDFSFVNKFSMLSNRDQQIVLSMMDSMLSQSKEE